MTTFGNTLAAPTPFSAAMNSDSFAEASFSTDRYVVEAIHRAESGRRAWFILAVAMLTTVAAFAFVSA